jgi:hypothetical protein
MNCLQLFRRSEQKRYKHAAAMANPSTSKLGKRARSNLQRTVSRDSLSDLNKLNGLDMLTPISDNCCSQRCGEEQNCASQEGARSPIGETGGDWTADQGAREQSVNVSLEGLRLEERSAIDQGPVDGAAAEGFGQGTDKGRLLESSCGSSESTTSPHAKTRRKWWAIGSRAYSAAATSPPQNIPIPNQVTRRTVEQEPLSIPSQATDMEITLNDTSPKWARSVGSDEADQQSLWEQPAQLKKGSKPEDSQEDSNQKQRVGSRGAAFLRKEQVSERLHHAAHRSPKKEGKPRSPTLSPIVYCRQDSGQELAEVLNACGCCRKALDSKKDIYMYG